MVVLYGFVGLFGDFMVVLYGFVGLFGDFIWFCLTFWWSFCMVIILFFHPASRSVSEKQLGSFFGTPFCCSPFQRAKLSLH